MMTSNSLTLRLLSEDREIFRLSGEIKSQSVDNLSVKIYWNGGSGELDDWLKGGGGEFNKSKRTVKDAQDYLIGLAKSKNIQNYQILMEVRG